MQRTNKKIKREDYPDFSDSTAEYIVLKPIGYPLTSILEEYPEIENEELFQFYAREQWNGYVAYKNEFLFDRRMYPDFAYKILEVEPPESIIGMETRIFVKDEKTLSKPIEFKSRITMDNVVGQSLARKKCKLIEKYLENPLGFGKWAPRNVLFHGPSGTGKTMFAKALANKTNSPIIPVKATQLIGEFVGEGARQIHQLYEKASNMAPCIIFIDELDAIALDRRHQELRGDVSEIVNALLTEMDGIIEHEGICTIGATNRIDVLDSAIRSRFEEEIEFVLPDESERAEIIQKNITTFPIPITEIDISRIAKYTSGLSGRDLVEKLLKSVLHSAIVEDKKYIDQNDFDTAINKLMKTEKGTALDTMYS
ncbi:AAA family ATPase [Methanosalsum natronophilum]|uniref:AAA family ATPase n=1 Tax=Methanosalsum natronophilum TaxID=768733 RepID=UPI00216980F1|nr:AAA family ATPase [Methanosalsum natronophilum]